MAKNIITAFESLNLILKLILIFLFGWIISGAYRILKFIETKEVSTLVIAIIGLATGIGNVVLEVVDFVSEIINGKIEYLVEI